MLTKDSARNTICYLTKPRLPQFIRFCVVGLGNTLIDFGVYTGLTRGLGVYFLYANFISVGAALLFSFVGNKWWTFSSGKTDARPEFMRFLIVNIVYYFLNNALLYLFVVQALIPDLWAKIMVVGIGLLWNFFANKYWTFARRG